MVLPEYKNADGSKIVVLPAGKTSGRPNNESKVKFYSRDNQRLCTLDLSSPDGEHGFGLIKAAWTPDEQYFVLSLASSGGHQPWHTPIVFYSLRDNMIRSLDSYTEGPGISQGDFRLEAPNTVLTAVFREPRMPVKLRLDSLTEGNEKSRPALYCGHGKVVRVDPYDLRSHE